MPAISFKVFREKLENGTKRQTIRLARKRPIVVGDKLYLYWHQRQKDCRPILVNGESVVRCNATARLNWLLLSHPLMAEFEALRDGFDSAKAFLAFFEEHYHPQPETLFDIVRW